MKTGLLFISGVLFFGMQPLVSLASSGLIDLSTLPIVGGDGSLVLRPSIGIQMAVEQKNAKKIIRDQQALVRRSVRENTKKITVTPTPPRVNIGSIKTVPSTFLSPKINTYSPTQAGSGVTQIKNVNMAEVRAYWMTLYNTVRAKNNLAPYTYNSELDRSASVWNPIFAASSGINHHRRSPGDSYYDYPTIEKWFNALGLFAPVIERATFTENVGYGNYTCNKSDCTEDLKQAIRSTFLFYLSEKGKSYDAHYRSIVQPNFTEMGMDILVNPREGRYYLTVHYATEVEKATKPSLPTLAALPLSNSK